MTQLNRLPTYQERLETNGATTRGYYSLWSGLVSGQPTGLVAAITLTASPFAYVAPVGGTVLVSGGTVNQIQFSRDGSTFYATGATAGMFPVSQGDTLKITYSAAPTLTWVPR